LLSTSVTGYFKRQVVLKTVLFVVIEDVLVHLVIHAGQCGIKLGYQLSVWLFYDSHRFTTS